MALKDLVQRNAATAFEVIGDLKETVTYKRRTTATNSYNPASGVVGAPAAASISVTGVLTSAPAGGRDVSDQKEPTADGVPHRFFLVLQASINFVPKPQDEIHLANGQKYVVIQPITADPARATWRIALRALP